MAVLDFNVVLGGTDDCAVVTVRGELDIATAPQLVEALEGAVARESARVVVDLLQTSFIDSTGLTTLLRTHNRMQSEGGEFAIVCGPDNYEIRRVIDLMGFNEVLTIHESLAAAGCAE